MRKQLSKAPSPALTVALLALFVALGGTAYAASSLPRDSVGTAQLKNGAVTGTKIATGAVTAATVKTHTLLAKDFAKGQVPTGPPGPGYQFTHSTSLATPSAGTYFVVVEVALAEGDAPVTGYCGVTYITSEIQGALFGGAFALPDNSGGGIWPPFSFSGIAVVPAGTQQLNVSCKDTSGNPVIPESSDWWVAPLGS